MTIELLAKGIGYAFFAAILSACGNSGQNDVGEINNDITGNEIKIDSFEDEKVSGITCHIAHFDRSVIDRLRKGSWFENPSNGSINCEQTGPILIGDIKRGKSGESLLKQKQALWFKTLSVRRVYDREADTLIYLIYSKEVVDGSAKMSISTVPLYGRDVTWKE
ncbi:CreA family protein [Litorimonas haliclonae]|uniref:CreA family protein n=1 Tax=Litorimonas haliclonae TaxID=2081977 RepID=UPI0039EFBCB5